MTYLQCFS